MLPPSVQRANPEEATEGWAHITGSGGHWSQPEATEKDAVKLLQAPGKLI